MILREEPETHRPERREHRPQVDVDALPEALVGGGALDQDPRRAAVGGDLDLPGVLGLLGRVPAVVEDVRLRHRGQIVDGRDEPGRTVVDVRVVDAVREVAGQRADRIGSGRVIIVRLEELAVEVGRDRIAERPRAHDVRVVGLGPSHRIREVDEDGGGGSSASTGAPTPTGTVTAKDREP